MRTGPETDHQESHTENQTEDTTGDNEEHPSITEDA